MVACKLVEQQKMGQKPVKISHYSACVIMLKYIGCVCMLVDCMLTDFSEGLHFSAFSISH